MTKTEFYKLRKKANIGQVKTGLVISKSSRHVSRLDKGEFPPSPSDIAALMVLAGYNLEKIKKYLQNVVDNKT